MAVKPTPDGYHSVTPYLYVDDAPAAIEFYKEVFGASERMRLEWQGGKIGHAELQIGDSVIMLASEFPEMGVLSPSSVGGTPVSLMVYVENVDEVFARALAEGAEEIRSVANQFYGDRSGTFRDPRGHLWTVSTHVEDVPAEELERRTKKMLEDSGSHEA